MAVLTSKAVSAKLRGEPGHFADGNGLYLVVPSRGRAYWPLCFTSNSKRKQMTLGILDDLSLADARVAATSKMKQLREGLGPSYRKKIAKYGSISCVDDLFNDWHENNIKRLKHHQIPKRVYIKDISPLVGQMQPAAVTGRDFKQISLNITESNRPSIANDALQYCKQLFNHGIKLDIISYNPAFAFSVNDAGGIKKQGRSAYHRRACLHPQE